MAATKTSQEITVASAAFDAGWCLTWCEEQIPSQVSEAKDEVERGIRAFMDKHPLPSYALVGLYATEDEAHDAAERLERMRELVWDSAAWTYRDKK
jgi:hypothetical protein